MMPPTIDELNVFDIQIIEIGFICQNCLNFLSYAASISLSIISKHLWFGSRSFLWSFILRPQWRFPKLAVKSIGNSSELGAPASLDLSFLTQSYLVIIVWILQKSFMEEHRKIDSIQTSIGFLQTSNRSLNNHWYCAPVGLAFDGSPGRFFQYPMILEHASMQICSKELPKDCKPEQTWNGNTMSQS